MISSALASVLSSGRAQLNQQVAETRRRCPAFDSGAFSGFVETGVDAVVNAVTAVAPERATHSALVAFAIALELAGLGLTGKSLLQRAWCELAPACAHLLAAAPAEVLGRLSHAALHLDTLASVRHEAWLETMRALAPQADSVAQLQALGQVVAWTAGVAHFRTGALAAADSLPPALALAAFDTVFNAGSGNWPRLQKALLADPWYLPGGTKGSSSAGREFGAFSGLGGAFAEPPQLRASDDGFWVHSGGRYSLLVADAYGALLHGASADEFEQAPPASVASDVVLNGARLNVRGRLIDLDLPASQIALVSNRHTVAVTSPYTHAIRLLPLS